jgi:diaminohydroxyphosphoribosylaminopyrimidine deaminase/5-amino-6-(5-phosphoribosylamino)uracil reductase
MTEDPMRLALELARQGRRRTAPNPMVGAVVVDAHGRVVGEGFHAHCGGPHAEVLALARAGTRARGGTLYVTLEPCCHQGRTPPCTDAIRAAGLRRVVYGAEDPGAGGGGLAVLRAAGLTVELSPLTLACQRLIRPYVLRVVSGRPYVVAKWAMTLEGRLTTAPDEPRWITGEAARAHVHTWRDRMDAVLVGCGTVRVDDPELTCRGVPDGRNPLRVVLDGQGCLAPAARVVTSARVTPTVVATTDRAEHAWRRDLERAGVEVLCHGTDGQIDLPAVLAWLAARGVTYLLVEGGSTTLGRFRDAGLIDAVMAYVAPRVLGGRPGWTGPVAGGPGDGLALEPVQVEVLDGDVCLSAEVRTSPGANGRAAGPLTTRG